MTTGPARRPQAILFDLDNTLCNFVEAKQAACKAVIDMVAAGSADDLFAYFLRPVHGFENPAHIRDYLVDINWFSEDFFPEITERYEDVKIRHIRQYEGVTMTLEKIASLGIRMAVVTDAQTSQAEKRLKKAEIEHFFPVLVTPEISGKRKPSHDSFLLALQCLGTTTRETWVVGDSVRREIIPGNELGMTTVHAAYGDWMDFRDPGGVPGHTIWSFTELLDLLV